MTRPSEGAPADRRGSATLEAAAAAYGWVYFTRRAPAALAFAAATLIVPSHGLVGAAGAACGHGWAWLLGRSDRELREGYDAFNGLLVGLALALYFRPTAALTLLLLLGTLLSSLLVAGLRALSARTLGVPVLSLPFVLATWVALLAARRFAGLEPALDPVLASGVGSGVLPAAVEHVLRSLGAAFFQLSVPSGALVAVGLVLASRWSAVLGLIGLAAGAATYAALGGPADDLTRACVGFNFALTGIAVGGFFVILSPASLLLAAAGGALSAVLSAALLAALAPLGLPVLAMPFIASTQLLLLAVGAQPSPRRVRAVRGVWDSPEENLERARFLARRFPAPEVPAIFLPVLGEWLVTQGPDDQPTHQPPWADAWDLEVADDEGATARAGGRELTDYHAFGAPVHAPGDAKVVRAVGHLPDTPVGEVDAAHNWGNAVVLWHGGSVYTALCHLRQRSLAVREGERVDVGQLLARVGSSGRSPVPHLHVQLQASPELGAPTLRGSLLHYVARDDAGSGRYVTSGSPRRGQRVRALEVDEAVRRAVALPPGRRWTWTVRAGGAEREERWVSAIDPLGRRTLETDDGAAAIELHSDEHYLALLGYRGPTGCLLATLFLGAPRVPYLGVGEVGWEDALSPAPFLGPLGRLAYELALPFVETTGLRTDSRWTPGPRPRLATRVEAVGGLPFGEALPDRVEVTFAADVGPVAITAWRGDEALVEAEGALA